MICPKCGFEQPDGAECARCGIIVSRYKGPFLGAAALRPPISAPVLPPPPAEKAPTLAADGVTPSGAPSPTMAAGDRTSYGGRCTRGRPPEPPRRERP